MKEQAFTRDQFTSDEAFQTAARIERERHPELYENAKVTLTLRVPKNTPDSEVLDAIASMANSNGWGWYLS